MKRTALFLSGLLVICGCDFAQREADAPATTFAVALQDGPLRTAVALEDAVVNVSLVPAPDGVTLLDFALRARAPEGETDRMGYVRGSIALEDPVLGPGRFTDERAHVAYAERRDGTERRYAFSEALLELRLDLVTERRVEGHYRVRAEGREPGPSAQAVVSISGTFAAER